MTPITATAVMVCRNISAAIITLMAGSMENSVPTTRADVMRPDSTAYAPPTIMFSAPSTAEAAMMPHWAADMCGA